MLMNQQMKTKSLKSVIQNATNMQAKINLSLKNSQIVDNKSHNL